VLVLGVLLLCCPLALFPCWNTFPTTSHRLAELTIPVVLLAQIFSTLGWRLREAADFVAVFSRPGWLSRALDANTNDRGEFAAHADALASVFAAGGASGKAAAALAEVTAMVPMFKDEGAQLRHMQARACGQMFFHEVAR
jgi:hypothetical protein